MKRWCLLFLLCTVIVALISCNKEVFSQANMPLLLDTRLAVTQLIYSSTFDVSENPISEGGRWLNGKTVGLDWANVKTIDGIAKGNSTYPDWWRDATALLSGVWSPDQMVEATVWCQPKTTDEHMESEIRLRSSLSAHRSTGYEVLFNCNQTSTAYMYIVRWNGAEQDFTILVERTGASWGVRHGDVVKATIVGNIITGYVNNVPRIQAIDNTYSNGAPGIGFDHNMEASNEDIGFTNVSVSSIIDAGDR